MEQLNAKDIIAKGYDLITKTTNNQYIGFDGIFKADARIEEKISGKSTITSFYVEDGSEVSDNIIVDSDILTVTGEVADVVFQENLLLNGYIRARETLGNINVYLPTRTMGQISQIDKIVNTGVNEVRRIQKVINNIEGIKNFLLGTNEQNNQTIFINFIKSYYQNKQLMKVETAKYGILEDMAIMDYSITSQENTHISYTINFKQIRKVQTIVTPINEIAKNPTGTQAGTQTQKKQDKGVVQGTQQSLLTKIGDLF